MSIQEVVSLSNRRLKMSTLEYGITRVVFLRTKSKFSFREFVWRGLQFLDDILGRNNRLILRNNHPTPSSFQTLHYPPTTHVFQFWYNIMQSDSKQALISKAILPARVYFTQRGKIADSLWNLLFRVESMNPHSRNEQSEVTSPSYSMMSFSLRSL
jgi:hypothetical protein